MNQSNAAQQQGLPPPHYLQNQRAAGLIQHQRPPNSPHRPQSLQSTPQGPYVSPHPSTPSLSQHHQSPYVGSLPSVVPQQHPGEPAFFAAHPSPYSTHSATGSYTSSDHNETMATQAAMSRQPYPPIGSYQTPQSNSPASIHSPQHDAQGRPLFSMPSMSQQMYYQQYQVQQQQQQSPYAQQPPPPPQQHPSITSAPGMLVSQQHHPSMSQPHPSSRPQQSMMDNKPPQQPLPRPPSGLGPQSAPQTPSGPGMPYPQSASAGPNSNAAPGPIPATTPLVVRQDNNGVQWIAFEYSRDRVKMEYTIRCDVESVNVDELSQEFKTANCVYPRACVSKENYKGNRLHYESECNAVGWALAQLNPNLREKRGLIQRAVDSWRNSNQDVRLRSRRVRRMAKINTRKSHPASMGPGAHMPGPPGSSGGLHASHGLPPSARPPSMAGPGMPHHGDGSDGAGHDDVTAGNEYSNGPAHHHPPPNGHADLTSPASSSVRYTQNFYPSFPQQPGAGGSTLTPAHGSMDPMHQQASTLATPAAASLKEEEGDKRALFGDLPEAKRRKFILVDDNQRGTRVRVRVMLDQVKMDDMPDAHLKINAVYPRSYYPRQMRSPPGSPGGHGHWDDDSDVEEGESGTMPTRGKTMVPVSLMDGTDTKMPVPRMTKSRRSKEVSLNELGYRMSWGQARTFNGRTLFLQRSLDAYRNKMRSTMIANGNTDVAPHFETRPGKRRWLERSKRARAASP